MTRPTNDRRLTRKIVIVELISIRRQLDTLLNELTGDPEHREFARKVADGEQVAVRHHRPYDSPTPDPVEVEEAWGVANEVVSDDTPEWWEERYGHLRAAARHRDTA